MKKFYWLLLFIAILLLFFLMGLTSFAQENDELPTLDSYVEPIIDEMPEEVKEHLPKGDSYEEIAQNADSGYLLSLSLSFLKQSLESIYTYLAFFLSVLILGSLAERIEESFEKKDNGLASYIALLLIAFEAFTIIYSVSKEVFEYCSRINAYMLSFTTVMSSVLLLGGGTMQATKSGTALSITVSLLGGICGYLLFPIIRISFASSITSIASKQINLSSVSSFLRGLFTFLIGFISLISIVAITFQSMLAQAEDTLAARSIRFAASSSIPIVGNAVGDSVRTLGAAVSVIQKGVGTIGVIGLIIMTLYPVSILFATKIALSLSKSIAGLLNVSIAEKLLGDLSHIVNMLLATVSILSVLYIFATALFTGSTIPTA